MEVMAKFIVSILMMVTWVHILLSNTSRFVYIKYLQLLYASYTPTKQFLKRTKVGAFSSVKFLE